MPGREHEWCRGSVHLLAYLSRFCPPLVYVFQWNRQAGINMTRTRLLGQNFLRQRSGIVVPSSIDCVFAVFAKQQSDRIWNVVPANLKVVVKSGEDLQLFVKCKIDSVTQGRGTKKSVIVLCATILAVPQPEVPHDVGNANVAKIAIQLLAGCAPKPQQPARTEAGVIELVAKVKSQAFESRGGALRLFQAPFL